jgi:hypothetical protein
MMRTSLVQRLVSTFAIPASELLLALGGRFAVVRILATMASGIRNDRNPGATCVAGRRVIRDLTRDTSTAEIAFLMAFRASGVGLWETHRR